MGVRAAHSNSAELSTRYAVCVAYAGVVGVFSARDIVLNASRLRFCVCMENAAAMLLLDAMRQEAGGAES
jgi:hypothetical protein